MNQVTYADVLSIYEHACDTIGYGRGIGARAFFSVDIINKLIEELGNSNFTPIETSEKLLAIPVDDVGELCGAIINRR